MDARSSLLLLAGGLLAACARPVSADRAHERTLVVQTGDQSHVTIPRESRGFVRMETVATRADWALLRAPGRVAFREGALGRVGAPVTARVSQVHAVVGQRVAEGDPLITIESPEALAMRASARTSAQVEHAARAELARVRRLADDGVANEREILEAELRESSTVIDATRAQSTLAFLGSGGGRNVVLRSPIDGVVLSLDATVGSVVTTDERSLVEVGDPSRIWVECQVFQADLGLVEVGQHVTVQVGPTSAVPGRIVAIGADLRESHTAVVRIELDEVTSAVRPGEYVRVAIQSLEPVIVVPATSVVVRDGRQYAVYVEVGHRSYEVERRIVTVGASFDGQVSITSGLRPGERIVTSGTLLLDGAADQLL